MSPIANKGEKKVGHKVYVERFCVGFQKGQLKGQSFSLIYSTGKLRVRYHTLQCQFNSGTSCE